MTDELTPQEKEALKGLPRERMPAGLEARVTDAMRDHGFLEKRRRTIAITNGRIGGLLAACVALVIGAYSIGLHRGGDDPSLPGVGIVGKSDGKRADELVVETPEKKEAYFSEVDEVREAEPTFGTDNDHSDVEKSKPGRTAAPRTTPPASSDQPVVTVDELQQMEAEEEGLAKSARELASPPAETPTPTAALSESADRIQARQRGVANRASEPPFTFLLNGSRVIVDAPDSVRVVQDAHGRTLLIYTSDGVIRVYLGDDE